MVLGLQDIQGYGMLSILVPEIWDTVFHIFAYFQGHGVFRKLILGIWDTSLFTSRDMGYWQPPYTSLINVQLTREARLSRSFRS